MYRTEIAWKSLHKYGEELCGDRVELVKAQDGDIVILADGMGSGVKANILATLTARILGTMLREGASIPDCVETVAKTLPVCRERQTAYATFSILKIGHNGNGWLVEYDNPLCVFLRQGELVRYPYKELEIQGKRIREYRFQAEEKDCLVLFSDGAVYAGAQEILNYSWTWEELAAYGQTCMKKQMSASRLCAALSEACRDLYQGRAADDTTVVTVRICREQVVSLLTGPPLQASEDEKLVRAFMEREGKKVLAGGSTANMASRILDREIRTLVQEPSSQLPPTAVMDGIDLVTEGALTLGGALELLKKFAESDFDMDFFRELDKKNGASLLAKLLLEECTTLYLYVGTAVNEAYKDASLPFDISVRKNLVEQLAKVLRKLGKNVEIQYF